MRLPLDPGEVGDGVDGGADAGEEVQARGTLGRVGVVDGDGLKERVDRCSQASERRHRRLEILRLDRAGGGGFGGVERGGDVEALLGHHYPGGGSVQDAIANAIATIGENIKTLIFPLAELPEMGRGKGVSSGSLPDSAATAAASSETSSFSGAGVAT